MDNLVEITVYDLIEQLANYPNDAIVYIAIGEQEVNVTGLSCDGERLAITGDVR